MVVDAVLIWSPRGRWGAHLLVLCLGLDRLLSGPTCGGPTLTASGEPRVPLLRQAVFVLVEVEAVDGAPDLSAEVAVVSSLTFAALVEGRALKWSTNKSWSSSSPYAKKSEHGRQKDLPGIGTNV